MRFLVVLHRLRRRVRRRNEVGAELEVVVTHLLLVLLVLIVALGSEHRAPPCFMCPALSSHRDAPKIVLFRNQRLVVTQTLELMFAYMGRPPPYHKTNTLHDLKSMLCT